MATRRVTVTVEESLLQFASGAVELGDADSVSAWISQAMADRYTKEQRLLALTALIADYESEHGVITADEMDVQRQQDRDAAAAVRAVLPR